MQGAACGRKGKRFERELVGEFARVFGVGAVRRGMQYRGGAECSDVVCPSFWVEAKSGKLTNPRAALRQAIADSEGKGLWPIAVCKDDRQAPTVTILLEDFLDLLSEWYELKTA